MWWRTADFSPTARVAQVIDMTVADSDEDSGVQDRDGFLSQRSRRRVVASAIPAAVPFVQANRFSPLNAEIEAVVESQGPRVRRRLTLVGGHDDAQHPSVSQFDVRATVPDSNDSVEVANTMEDHSDGESAGSAVDEVPEGEVDVDCEVESRNSRCVDLSRLSRPPVRVQETCVCHEKLSHIPCWELQSSDAPHDVRSRIGKCQWG